MNSKVKIKIEKNIDSYTIRKKFKSKRNEVYLLDLDDEDGRVIPCVFKKYAHCKSDKSKETFLLKTLRENGLTVPRIYFEGAEYILLEYLAGDTLLDVMTDLENSQGDNIDYEKNHVVLCKLFKWLQRLYSITNDTMGKSYIFGDMNLRNFIINDEMYGVDLEDCNCKGYKEEDGGKFCAFLLTYSPAFTKWKVSVSKQAVEILTQKFGYNKQMLKDEVAKELSEINKRRGMEIPKDIIEKIF